MTTGVGIARYAALAVAFPVEGERGPGIAAGAAIGAALAATFISARETLTVMVTFIFCPV